MPIQLQIVLAGLVVAAGVYDVRFRRIPNWLCLSGLILGIGLNLFYFESRGISSALLGLGLALAIYVPLYYLRGMGAGDVKLMAAIGTIAGPENWLAIFFATALAGGVVSLAVVAYKRRIGHTLINLALISSDLLHFRRPADSNPEFNVKHSSGLRLPHAVSIALGCCTFLAVLSRQ